MRDSGRMTNSMARARNAGLMAAHMLGAIDKARRMVWASICGQMAVITMAVGLIIRLKEKGPTVGLMAAATRELGSITICTGLEPTHGPTEGHT